jgi:LacI family gluconate utilization system Gnt-I transcriptional repressor
MPKENGTRRPRSPGTAVRIEEVARLAGVSAITVSRALNTPDKVAEKTRKAVWEAVEKTGYIPNRLAGSLASNRSRTIGVIIPTIINSIFADKVQGMTDVLLKEGYHLMLANSGYSLEVESDLVSAFVAQRPSGLVLTGVSHDDRTRSLLGRAGIAVVETWSLGDDPIDMLVGFSNEDAARAMVLHLHGLGYRRIGLVSAPVDHNDRAASRVAGYRKALRECGLPEIRSLEREAAFSFRNGALALSSLLDSHPDIDAIFFANDILAAGALLECQRRGIAVPDDLGIAGFDDVDLAAETVPGLTTVRIPRYEIGARAAQLILDRIGGREPEEKVIDLGFEIVSRGSTRAAPPAQASPARRRAEA